VGRLPCRRPVWRPIDFAINRHSRAGPRIGRGPPLFFVGLASEWDDHEQLRPDCKVRIIDEAQASSTRPASDSTDRAKAAVRCSARAVGHPVGSSVARHRVTRVLEDASRKFTWFFAIPL
jgi:hypothetical protein